MEQHVPMDKVVRVLQIVIVLVDIKMFVQEDIQLLVKIVLRVMPVRLDALVMA